MPKILNKWQGGKYYMGEDMSDHYVVLSQHRDSDIIAQSNFESAVRMLTEVDPDSENFTICRFGHWAVGWMESIMVPINAPYEIIGLCEDIVNSINQYPILDRDHHSEMKHDYIVGYWQTLDSEERAQILRDNGENGKRWRSNYPVGAAYDYLWDIID